MDGMRMTRGWCVIVAALASAAPAGCKEPDDRVFFEKKTSEVAVCRVSLGMEESNVVEWRTRNAKLMKELILDPLAKAKADPRREKYQVLGRVVIERKDGSKEFFHLFYPWGYVARGDAYQIADFSQLRAALKEHLKDALRWVELE
jgi:hypothetical protein